MCGIAGIFSYRNNGSLINKEELLQVRDAMIPRGPDGYGLWISQNKNIGLAHRRLSIIDLSDAGAQPMTTEDGKSLIVFNGEIYNYRDIRARLVKKGYRFHSQSDTEVLLHLYAEKGMDMIHELRGMFAFAIWDEDKKGLFLARDPFGIKPLYYADDGKTLWFASQVKALIKGKGIDTAYDPAGHVGFFLWGHVPEPHTLYKAIRSLPAGSYIWVDENGHKTLKNYCNILDIFKEANKSISEFKKEEMHEHLRSALLDTVQHHLIADVPVGTFLSSGLDSATITALVADAKPEDLYTITLGFREYEGTRNDETPLAALVARHYESRHQTIWVQKEDFKRSYEHLVNSMDQPTIDGVNTYFVSKVAAKTGLKVCLSGLGGDELFGGYSSFQDIPRLVRTFRYFQSIPLMGKSFRIITAPVIKYFASPKYAGLLEYGGNYGGAYLLRRSLFMPWELPKLLDGDMVREGWRELSTLLCLNETIKNIKSDYLKVACLEMNWYMRNQLLRDADWAGMAHSLEIRVPLVDIILLKKIAPFLAGDLPPTKMDTAIAPVKPLPNVILNRRKTGFSIPVHEWIMRENIGENVGNGLREWAKIVYQNFMENSKNETFQR